MSTALLFAAAALYAVSGALLLGELAGRVTARNLGAGALALAAAAHLGHDALRWAAGHGPLSGIHEGLSTLGLLVLAGWFVLRVGRPRMDAVGALLAPIALALLLVSAISPAGAEPHLGGALLVLHVGSTLLSIAAFTVAFSLSVAYLVQDRQVKQKKLGGVFKRLPPLQVLDDLNYRCVALGLVALTLGVVTGLFVGASRPAGAVVWQQYVALGAWVLFAAVFVARLVAGWRGRRAAIGTILGYAGAVVVLAGYVARSGAG